LPTPSSSIILVVVVRILPIGSPWERNRSEGGGRGDEEKFNEEDKGKKTYHILPYSLPPPLFTTTTATTLTFSCVIILVLTTSRGVEQI